MNMTYSGQYPEHYMRVGHLRSYFKVIDYSTLLLTFTKTMFTVSPFLTHLQFRSLLVYDRITFADVLVATIQIKNQL